MDQEEGVITFGQIWRVVKKSLARAAIYVVVCAILSFAVLFTVRTVSADKSYSATITFKQSDANIKSTLDGYRATATNKAIIEVFDTSEDTTEIYENVLKTLTITAYVPEDYESDTTYVATTFTVSFDEIGVSGVNSNQQISLLESICNKLISYYTEVNSIDLIDTSLAWSYSADYSAEFLDIIDELSSRISTAKSTMSSNIAANVAVNSEFATYRSTSTDSSRRTAYEILAQIDNISYTISALEDTVLANGITNTGAKIYGDAYCQSKIDSLNVELTALTTVADAYKEQIDVLAGIIEKGFTSASSTSSTGTTTIGIDISSYTSLVEQYMEVTSNIASVERQIAEIELYKTNIASNASSNSENMVDIKSTIETAISDMSDLFEEYNDLVAEFEEQVMPTAYATISVSAAAYNESFISMSLLLIIVFAIMVIAYLVAFGQTWSAMSKAGTLDEDKVTRVVKNKPEDKEKFLNAKK